MQFLAAEVYCGMTHSDRKAVKQPTQYASYMGNITQLFSLKFQAVALRFAICQKYSVLFSIAKNENLQQWSRPNGRLEQSIER